MSINHTAIISINSTHSTMFLNRNIYKYAWTSSDGKTYKQNDHILIDRRWNLSILDVLSFRGVAVILITIWWLQRLGKDWHIGKCL
jgi:hypothetical protein